MKIYSEFVDSLLHHIEGDLLSGGCRGFLQAFFRRGAFLGPILVGLLGGKIKQFYLMFGYHVHTFYSNFG